MSRLPDAAVRLLRCPACHREIEGAESKLSCVNESCGATYHAVDSVPILVDSRSSIFSLEDFTSRRTTTLATGRRTGFKAALKSLLGVRNFNGLRTVAQRVLPTIDRNLCSDRNYHHLNVLLAERDGNPLVLVLGGGVLGQGISALMSNDRLQFVESDVSFGPRTCIIFDAHEIPFADGTFDAVIAQAVLEHVADPYRCVDEIHRVLKSDGLVYAETPFMQQVHAGRYDFTRFTHLGHRRLFRRFEEIDSGIVCGPGMALSWSYQYFLTSLFTSRSGRALARNAARFTSFFFKYFDPLLANRAGAYDAASGFYLLGRRAELAISDRELIRLYRGFESQ